MNVYTVFDGKSLDVGDNIKFDVRKVVCQVEWWVNVAIFGNNFWYL
jgi:hypothetical protein